MWKNTYRRPAEYLQENAKMRKWINQCVNCQAQGYKPEMPGSPDSHRDAMQNDEEIVNAEFMNIRYRFQCLPLNEIGLCEICEVNKIVTEEIDKEILEDLRRARDAK